METIFRSIIEKIENVNNVFYNTQHKGKDFYDDIWSNTTHFKDGEPTARFLFEEHMSRCEEYSNFAKYDFYWNNFRKNLQLEELNSPGYVNRIQKYLKSFASNILDANYNELIHSIFIQDLLNDGYISNQEAEAYCRLLPNVHNKILSDIQKIDNIILDITSPVITNTRTPALDFLFHNVGKGERERFIAFFKSKQQLKFTATDVVQILFLALNGRDRFDALNKNGMSANLLWSDLRSVNIIGGGVVTNVTNRTLNIAAKRNAMPRSTVKTAWETFKK